jgi:putative methyltransferase (TIGR04325 family)
MRANSRQLLESFPLVGRILRARHERRVRSGPQGWRFWRVFSSYAQAIDGARALSSDSRTVGYDAAEVANKGSDIYQRMYLHDYPAFFWLSEALRQSAAESQEGPRTVIDLGGHLGEKRRLFGNYCGLTPEVRWTVIETSAGVEAARLLPSADRPPGLSFTTERRALDGAHVLYASGSLQYLEQDIWSLLDDVADAPDHLVLNKVPLSTGNDFWTVQNVWVTAVPYHVMSRSRFLGELTARGYRLLDEWQIPEFSVSIPFFPEFGTKANAGLYLRRAGED